MKTRFIAFSVFTAVGICFSASQSRADEPHQPNEITQPLAEPSAGNKVMEELIEEVTSVDETVDASTKKNKIRASRVPVGESDSTR